MTSFSSKTMQAIDTLSRSVDGVWSVMLIRHEGRPPRGNRQEYEGPPVNGIKHEWVDQSGGGFTGDDFHGTVTFVLGDYHLIASY
ncbi:hypothetical protein [Ochrobactrum sp. Marseille-Q0166]|uniref:hypothetical protein n=1 Tax=Ochrobactrum sp. Marseille-Q0166 TaxID=2761105 RepID=UPI001655A0B2|nr:hypothetical protein [Ochrobactrum sp. Marseille-Q0166]MBC8718775.1 hypothetical protein [Ochrobactrum sp. Marseille-Q0166]